MMLKTPDMAAEEPRPIRLMTMHQNVENQTAFSGVWVSGLTTTKIRLKGSRLSRERANTVRARACIAVKQTNWMIMKAKTVNTIPPDLPRLL